MKIAIFCGSSDDVKPRLKEEAHKIGTALGAVPHRLIYGGGNTGIMGAVSQGFRDAGAHITSVSVMRFHKPGWENLANEFIMAETIEIRKRIMFDNADGYLILPGSWGTMDEVAGIVMEAQYGVHRKPILFWGDFFKPLIEINRNIVEHDLAPHRDIADIVKYVHSIDDLLGALS